MEAKAFFLFKENRLSTESLKTHYLSHMKANHLENIIVEKRSMINIL